MAPPAPSSFPGAGGRDGGSSSDSSSGGGGGDSASSASASTSPPAAAPAAHPPAPTPPPPSAASAATAAAPAPPAIPLAPPPVLSVQQFPVLHYQSQFQQQQRLLSLHLSSSSPSPPHLLAPASSSPKPLLSLPPDPSPAPASAPAPAPNPHSRDDCWSEGATLTLIQAWGDRYLELNRGNLKQKHWKDVADCVNRRANGSKASKTDVQCKNRLDTLKKKYKLEKSKMVTGGGPSKWTFFERLDDLIGPNKKPKKPAPPQPAPPALPAAAATGINCSSKQLVPLRPPSPNKRLLEEVEQKPASFFSPIPPPAPASAPATAPAPHLHPNPNPNPNPHHLPTSAAPAAADTISQSKDSPGTTASCPNGLPHSNGKGVKRKKSSNDDNPFKELAKAILKFGEVYERIETSKQQQLMDLEKQRMEFTKDLELQRLQLFMQTQVELAKLKHGSKHGNTEHYL